MSEIKSSKIVAVINDEVIKGSIYRFAICDSSGEVMYEVYEDDDELTENVYEHNWIVCFSEEDFKNTFKKEK
jgi:hypothetical protein